MAVVSCMAAESHITAVGVLVVVVEVEGLVVVARVAPIVESRRIMLVSLRILLIMLVSRRIALVSRFMVLSGRYELPWVVVVSSAR